ncbi:uncharacterized protein LOC119114386 isoform X2 [Pollicipes pollicipes]|uniref:uncharacterized protein LOC119114386 isoform X2 n=1 Tax=Pollicipes pollicipes TaxID=41117 RepID=UPI001884C202|nr:uncharacterized protein LOC119114386 isoform X2 [Pollicipes pollicipes]
MTTMSGAPSVNQLPPLILLLLLTTVTGQNRIRIENQTITGLGRGMFDIQQAIWIQIINSDIQVVEEDTFLSRPGVNDATLEVLNTTVRHWKANDMSSFSKVYLRGTTISELHTKGMHRTQSEGGGGYPAMEVEFDAITIGKLHSNAINLGDVNGSLSMQSCIIENMYPDALRAPASLKLYVHGNTFDTISTGAFANVCSCWLWFIENTMSNVAPRSLYFGSATCQHQCYRNRPSAALNTIKKNVLTCGPQLDWLRATSHDSLTEPTQAESYQTFRNTSFCAGAAPRTPVWQYLQTSSGEEPGLESTQENGGGPPWSLLVAVAAGSAAATAAVTVVVTRLCIRRKQRRHLAQVENLRVVAAGLDRHDAERGVKQHPAQPDLQEAETGGGNLYASLDGRLDRRFKDLTDVRFSGVCSNLYADPCGQHAGLYAMPCTQHQYENVQNIAARQPPADSGPSAAEEQHQYVNLDDLDLAQEGRG